MIFDTGWLTDATAHAVPRLDVAVIVVAPIAAPLTVTVVSVCPAGMIAVAAAGAAIDGSIAASWTRTSVASGAGRTSRSFADPPSGTPSRRGTARRLADTDTTTSSWAISVPAALRPLAMISSAGATAAEPTL